jgi:hypothetical protein
MTVEMSAGWLNDLKIIHVDTHYTEPRDLWISRAPAAYRDRVPCVEMIDGQPTWVLDGVTLGFASGFGTVKADRGKVDLDAGSLPEHGWLRW